jgi:acyl dehydratase
MSTNAERAYEKFKTAEGKEDGVSDWHKIDQAQINLFAEATLDKQFIHTDPEMAARVSPFGKTIAHGFLTLSMIPYLGAGIRAADPAAYEGMLMGINYGLDKARFPSPVKVDSRIRARRELVNAEYKPPNAVQLKHKVTIEIEGEDKPACVAETLSRLVYA